ncbi:4-hydroxythreonine-4-phosphate dehydrogenase PdxA [Candidatus Liberibacter africanus]|uniref:4-hydroxythreonine-4-phosphate dehydrogenase n=1 Tax=Candidatus Liberibacter africanus PTSAPSY TaxID=1277257 RepID=A0A0G3I410_LIBAF|nr:4-hydroxythreonine-4-phosphate dehydrogenase PdxA [Candidatus Liberibacter africanus]AKK19950.1 4-hydroxythreonine-4-phosphate dehydrogenase [Candidatus Liberibacter africanus PTSAPSY]QTP63788.1 4-hydroxythreonine-4-phosphate dehydrogenase PdxA [Candidatus Liberibacter africanus]
MDEYFSPLPLILTQGDPAGIGPDISLKAWKDRKTKSIPPFIYVGDPDVLNMRAKQLNLDIPLYETDCKNAVSVFKKALPFISCPCGVKVVAGKPNPQTASSTISSIEKGVFLTLSGQALAIVTNPISKFLLYQENFKFPGHTEFLAELAKKNTGITFNPVMMLCGPQLRTVPVTIHIPITEIHHTLSTKKIIETSNTVHNSLKKYFGINHPRIAISGLNPHAGENATIGLEEKNIIAPAILHLKNDNKDVVGPLPADSMFHDSARKCYDVAICMYHDQALIPIKTLNFNQTVNITLGLPFIRTSPDHGTAFDIAGSSLTQEESLVFSLKIAAQLGYQKNLCNAPKK